MSKRVISELRLDKQSAMSPNPDPDERLDCVERQWSGRVWFIILLLSSSIVATALVVVATVYDIHDKPVNFAPYFRDGLVLSSILNIPLCLALVLVESRRAALVAAIVNAPIVFALAAYLYGWFFSAMIA